MVFCNVVGWAGSPVLAEVSSMGRSWLARLEQMP